MIESPVRETLLEARDVSVSFKGRRAFGSRATVKAVEKVDFVLRRGEIHALVGESGSGKTTLSNCLAGMQQPTSGTVLFKGEDVTQLNRAGRNDFRRRVQPVFQDPRTSLDPRWRVARSVREPLDAQRIGDRTERDARVAELMNLVALPAHLADRKPSELSGGQLQRVAIAAALGCAPDAIVADEPVSALDVSVQAQILNLLLDLRDTLGVGILLVSHDLAVVEHISDRVTVMYHGRIVESGTVRAVFENPTHDYTRALMAAIPHPDPGVRMDAGTTPAGSSPAPLNDAPVDGGPGRADTRMQL